MIKYRIITESVINSEYIFIVEDGGIATTHNTGEHILMDLYQSRISKNTPDEIWNEIAEGKMYNKVFPLNTELPALKEYALQWLYAMSKPSDFEEDTTIWESHVTHLK